MCLVHVGLGEVGIDRYIQRQLLCNQKFCVFHADVSSIAGGWFTAPGRPDGAAGDVRFEPEPKALDIGQSVQVPGPGKLCEGIAPVVARPEHVLILPHNGPVKVHSPHGSVSARKPHRLERDRDLRHPTFLGDSGFGIPFLIPVFIADLSLVVNGHIELRPEGVDAEAVAVAMVMKRVEDHLKDVVTLHRGVATKLRRH